MAGYFLLGKPVFQIQKSHQCPVLDNKSPRPIQGALQVLHFLPEADVLILGIHEGYIPPPQAR
jgi:hypothetical protein